MKSWMITAIVAACLVIGGVVSFEFLAGARSSTPAPPAAPPIDVTALRSKAEAGDPVAEAELGKFYTKGNNYTEAAKWLTRSADQTNTDGLLGLGELYEAGQGVPKDLDRAVKLYRQSADLGNADGQYTLAFMYESGRGVRQSHVEAAKWYQHAAEQGHALAQYDLGQRYNLGVGVTADKVEGLKWLILAANQGQADAANLRDKVKSELTRPQVTEAENRAKSFVSNKSAAR